MRNLLLALALLSIAGAQTVPENLRPSRSGRAVWIASIAALTAANIADAHTSWNKTEANRLLAGKDGNFGTRGAAIKGGVNGLWVASQVFAFRKNPRYRTLAIINFAAASFLGAVSYRNQRMGPQIRR